MFLGTCVDGRELTYDEFLFEFRLARSVVRYEDVADLDAHAHIHWQVAEQRDWFKHINPADLRECNRRALAELGRGSFDAMTPEEQVQADVARDDSILAGKIVDADPALVQAVAEALETRGIAARPPLESVANPLGMMDLPRGMEALSQLQRRPDQEQRRMTPVEALLMKHILKSDDRLKLRREKEGSVAFGASAGDAQGSVTQLSSRMTRDAIDTVAAQSEHHRYPQIGPSDSGGHPDEPSGFARPDVRQTPDESARAEAELIALRRHNAEVSRSLSCVDVPGMQNASSAVLIDNGSTLNGREVNPDGTPRRQGFKHFLHGLNDAVDVLAPPAGTSVSGSGGSAAQRSSSGGRSGMTGGMGR